METRSTTTTDRADWTSIRSYCSVLHTMLTSVLALCTWLAYEAGLPANNPKTAGLSQNLCRSGR